MRTHRLIVLSCALVLALMIAACGTDDTDEPDAPDVDDTTEEVTPDDDVEVETPEDAVDDEETPEVTEDDDATPEVTDDDTATPDDPAVTEQETAQVTIEEGSITIELDGVGLNGDDDEATPEADDEATPEADDEATPGADDDEATPGADDDEATPETDDETTPGIGDEVTFSTGNILFEITNNSDSEYGLAIERDDAAMNGTDDDATPEATPEDDVTDDDEATPEADDEATPEADDDTGMMALEELEETLAAGDSTEWEVNLEPGDYVMYATSDGEREMGMEVRFTVEENGMVNGVDDDDATPEATPDDEDDVTDDDATPEATPDDEEEDDD